MDTETRTVPNICGTPTALTVNSNGDNTFTISCVVGADGTNTTANGIRLYITCNGTTPASDNYNYTYDLLGAAGTKLTKIVSFAELSQSTIKTWLGADCIGNVKVKALTIGLNGDNSVLTSEVSTTFTWYGLTKPPRVLTPTVTGEITGLSSSYKVTWSVGGEGVNNPINNYSLSVYDITASKEIATFATASQFYFVAANIFTSEHSYIFYVTTNGTVNGFNGPASSSGRLYVKTINKFSSVVLQVQDGNTVPSTDILDFRTYIDIGSGTVAKLFWDTPTSVGNKVAYYKLSIRRYDPDTGLYYPIFDNIVNNVNKFYITSSMLSNIDLSQYQLSIYLTACSIYGEPYDGVSNTIMLHVSKGCGLYVKDTTAYPQPVMKRAIALTLVPEQGDIAVYKALADSSGNLLTDANDRQLYIKVLEHTRSVNNYSWNIMKEFYIKNSLGEWNIGDISYEVLTDSSGEIIVDANNEPIYVL